MINKILKRLHDEPIDIYEEQNRLKNHLSHDRQAEIESRELERSNKSLKDMIIEQHEVRNNLIKEYHDIIRKKQNDAKELYSKRLAYIQQKEQLNPTHPSFHKIITLLDNEIAFYQESINNLNESASEIKERVVELEEYSFIPMGAPNLNQSFEDVIATAYDNTKKIRELAAIFSQGANQEQHNLELKNKVETYAQMVSALKDNPMEISHEILAQAFENVVKHHAVMADEYLGIFEEITTSFPNMLHNIANSAQYQTDSMVHITQTIDATRDLDAQMRDRRIVEDLRNGSIGKYMQGDIPFINYLNLNGELAVLDIEHVSKEVELGKVKDRGVNYIIDLMEKNHKIILPFQDAFKLRLLLIEYHKVVEVSTKNNKLDYAKNYLNQHASLSAKAQAAGVSISPPLRNPSELKNLMQNILEQYSGADGYARDAMLELLDNGISRLPKKSPSK